MRGGRRFEIYTALVEQKGADLESHCMQVRPLVNKYRRPHVQVLDHDNPPFACLCVVALSRSASSWRCTAGQSCRPWPAGTLRT